MINSISQRWLYITVSVIFLWCVWWTPALAGTMSLSPSTGVYTAGEVFTTRVLVNTAGKAINAAEATLRFNPSELTVISVTKGSTFTLWAVEPSFSNSAGTINFGGGSPAGYTGSNGTVLTITWRSKGAGTARVSFANGSVLAADGRGTNIVTSLNGGSYTIAAADVQPEAEVIEYIAPANTPGRPDIQSATHDAEGWSQSTVAELTWSVPAGVSAVRTLLDANSGSIPTKVYEPAIDAITLDDLTDGVQYFHLQFRNADGWGRVAHYRLAVDTQAPTSFTIARSEQYDVTSPTQVLLLQTADETSSVVRFMVQHNDGEPYEYIDQTGSSTLLLENLSPGQHSFIIEAFDAAGNSRIATVSFRLEAFAAPDWVEYPDRVSRSVIPVLTGTTRPDATVFVRFRTIARGEQGDITTEYQVKADAEGVFKVIPDGRLAEGVYEITAYAIDATGAQSERTEPVRMIVTPPNVIVIGQWMVDVLSVFVPILALLGVLVLLVVYGIARFRRVRQYVRTETADALAVLEAQFSELRTAITEDTDALKSSRKTKKLTKAEASLLEDITDRVTATEAILKKEIGEVDDIVAP